MCGIAGLVTDTHLKSVGSLSAGMIDSMKHRGPDDHGWMLATGERIAKGRLPALDFSPEVMLLHCRLSIQDLSESGWQPMSFSGERYFIVFNGEIYNFKEIRATLEQKGHKFCSSSDTEVILAAYAQWGESAVGRFVGMFAFAIFDRLEKVLFLARDGFGIKPLYYTVVNNTFIFASEIPTLMLFPGVSRQADSQAIYDYLRFGASDHRPGKTMYSNIQQLLPGHTLTLSVADPSNFTLKKYWQPTLTEHCGLSFEDAVVKLRELFLESITLHLRSDVPVAASLSGGLDSSAVVMSMGKVMGAGARFDTFSFIAEEEGINEEQWVDDVVAASGAGNYKVRPSSDEFSADVDHLIKCHGEPVYSTSMYAQYRVCKLIAKQGIKVVLDGQGADEILAGYLYYLGARMTSLVRQGRYIDAGKFALQAWQRPGVGGQLINFTGEFLLPRHLHSLPRRLIGQPLSTPWFDNDWFEEQGVVMQTMRSSYAKDALREQLLQTLTSTGLPKLLRFLDRNSMAFSIESRVPFLTPAIVDFVFSLPEEYLIDAQGNSKSVFREAMRGIIPDSVYNRRDKVGFITPEQRWMVHMNDFVDETLHSSEARYMPFLLQSALREVWADIKSGKQPFTRQIWRLVNVIRWSKIYRVQFS
ncbi:MAG: asparagine synthase (glutamine-hydrolyzing) [Magnetococcales bacterium]|nr:asparagine synthase (glutamine-hydrolyzing) [Magnetococcales bacterium]